MAGSNSATRSARASGSNRKASAHTADGVQPPVPLRSGTSRASEFGGPAIRLNLTPVALKIPGAERAIVDLAKVRDYLLSPEHRVGGAKARFFAQLGLDQQNWAVLHEQLCGFAKQEAQLGGATRFGQKYVVPGTIQGPSGRSASLVVIWIILNGEDFPRFVTAYPGAQQ